MSFSAFYFFFSWTLRASLHGKCLLIPVLYKRPMFFFFFFRFSKKKWEMFHMIKKNISLNKMNHFCHNHGKQKKIIIQLIWLLSSIKIKPKKNISNEKFSFIKNSPHRHSCLDQAFWLINQRMYSNVEISTYT